MKDKQKGADKLADLKKKTPSTKEIEGIKGGGGRRIAGGDDDLKDLEVER